MSQSDTPTIAGVIWYTRESYPRCLAVFDDPGYYPDTFDEWFAKVQQTEKKLCRLGVRQIRVEIDPNTFPGWCRTHGFEHANAIARNHFANLKAAESIGIVTSM